MAFLVFVLSLVLLAAGLAAGYLSIDLLPTPPGLLDAFAGVVSVVGAIIVFALGLLILRIGRLTTALRQQMAAAALSATAPLALAEDQPEPQSDVPEPEPFEAEAAEEQEAVGAPAAEDEAVETEPPLEHERGEDAAEAAAEERPAELGTEPAADDMAEEEETVEDPVNENRSGRLPTLGEIERAIETPERPPTLIGRYTSGGANYMIFSDGSIEAETDEGAFTFASMGEFKKFLLDRGAEKP